MTNKTYVILVKTADGIRVDYCNNPHYIKSDNEFDVALYNANHPDKKIIEIFDTEDGLLHNEQHEKQEFEKYCTMYFFNPNDYYKYVCHNDKVYRFIGFLPQNTKYKARLFDTIRGCYIKATLDYVRKYMINN